MKFPLRKIFGARAAGMGLALAALCTSAQLDQADEAAAPPAPDPAMCIAVNQSDNFNSAAQIQLRDMLGEARRSLAAWHVLLDAWKAGTSICFQPGLSNPNNAKQIYLGSYHQEINTVKINPNTPQNLLVPVLVHESRHQQQIARNVRWAVGGNIPEHERMIVNWLRDADARVAAIVFAYEMEKWGEPKYMQMLAGDGGHAHMVLAFKQSLRNDPGDVKEAMRAALRAFRSSGSLARIYDRQVVEWVELGGQQFREDLPQKNILTDELLTALGEMQPYGNYMNDELMAWIRGSVTAKDYERHRERFYNNLSLRPSGPPPVCIEERKIS